MKRIFPVKVLTAVMLAVMTLCACDNGVPPELPLVPPDPPPWTYTYTLPETETVLTRIDEIYGSREKSYLLGDTVQRMPCPTAGNVMTFHMGYEVGAYARIVLEDAVDELNEVFAVVNPNYRFRINYAPTPSDYDSRYSIRMTLTDHFSSPTVMGTAQMSTGAELSNFGITLKDTTLDDLRYLMLTFRHEYMHLLGAGDAYENPLADKTTVMQNYNNTTYRHLSSSDVAFIDAYYRNPHNPLSDAEIKTFIADYETDNRHTQSELLSQVLHAAMHRDDTSVLLSELDAKHYADTAALRAELARAWRSTAVSATTGIIISPNWLICPNTSRTTPITGRSTRSIKNIRTAPSAARCRFRKRFRIRISTTACCWPCRAVRII